MNEQAIMSSAFAGTFVISFGLMPIAVVMGRRLGMVVQPRLFGRSFNSISYLGGTGVAVSVCAALAFGPVLYNFHPAIWAALLGAVMLLAFGVADDSMGADMPPLGRLGVQALTAFMVWSAGLQPTPTDIPWVDALLTVFFLTAATNSFNLLDNMDGIASSTAAAAFGGISVIAAMSDQPVISFLAAALSGAALGFIPHNIFRRHVYLGNGGALFLGFLVGCLTLMLEFPFDQPWGFASAIAILAVPAVDTTLVVLSRIVAGRSVLQGGVDHLSHRLVFLGMTTRHAALAHGVGCFIGAGSVVMAIQTGHPWIIAAVLALFGVLLVAVLRIDVYGDRNNSEEGRSVSQHDEPIHEVQEAPAIDRRNERTVRQS